MTEVATKELSPAQLNYAVDAEGGVVPLDPLVHTPLAPHTIPESLMSDPELSAGYAFLKQNAHRLNLALLLTRHTNAADLQGAGFSLDEEARTLAASNGTLFLEGIYNDRKHQEEEERAQNRISGFDARTANAFREHLDGGASVPSFAAEIMRQIAGTGVTVALPDYRKSDGSAPEQALTEWSAKLADIEAAILDADASQRPALYDQWQSSYLGYMKYRDWYLIGSMGAYLQKHDQPGESPIHAALLVGSTHASIGVEMGEWGTTIEYKGEENNNDPAARVLLKGLGRSVLSMTDRVDLLTHHLMSA